MGANASSAGGPGARAAGATGATDDLYDLLGVDAEATSDEIKKAFRKLALPDKVPESERPRANERFGKILRAFEVLSDDQERAWYDSHRHGLAAGVAGDGDLDLNPSRPRAARVSTQQLMRFFDFSGLAFDDTPAGFFGRYRALFDMIIADEAQATPYMGETLDPMPDFPTFGKADDAYEAGPRKFYAAWSNFVSRKSFAEFDQYRSSEAPDRRYKRAIEKENKRGRDEARREYVEAVRALVMFLKKRDPRFLNSASSDPLKARALEAQRLKADLSKASRDAAVRRAQQAAEYRAPEYAQAAEPVHALDSDGDLTDSDDDDADEIRCEACDKAFRTIGAWENHERSRKHLQAVKRLRRELLADDEELGLDSAQPSRPDTPSLSSPPAPEPPVADVSAQLAASSVAASEDEYDADEVARPQVGKKAKRAAERRARAAALDGLSTPSEPRTPAEGDTPSASPAPSKKDKRRAKEAAKKASGLSPSLACNVCKQGFPSRTKLFDHVRDSGHALADGYILVDDPEPSPSPGKPKRGKGKR